MRVATPGAFAVLALALGAGACGGGGGGPDARTDAITLADAPLAATCDWTEAHDAANDAAAEATGLAVGVAPVTICGAVDPGHFAGTTVDVDRYAVTVGAGGADLFVRLTGQGEAALGRFTVAIDDGAARRAYGVYVVDHGALDAHLTAGAHTISVVAQAAAATDAPMGYRVAIAPDAPATRCPRVTAAADHVETDESASQDTADDVVLVTATTEALTPWTTDAPDPSQIVVTAGLRYRISGTSANVDVAPPNGDDYHDRDTFLIATGADTNELQLRLDWTGTGNDLDVVLFPEPYGGDAPVDIGAGATAGPEELQTIAVAPSSRYWLWIGGHDGSKALPASYDASICGASFAP